MKLLAFVLFALTFCVVPTFGQMGIITTDEKLSALKKDGKYNEAIADITERIKAQPNNGELYLRRAEFLKIQDKLDEAIADISKGIEIEPDKPSFYIARAKYYNLKKNNEAVLKDVKTAVSSASNKTGVLISGARELTLSKQYEESVKLANFCLAHNNLNDRDANWLKYHAYKIRGESKFALKNYTEALEDSITAINFISFTGDYNKDLVANNALQVMSYSEVVSQTTKNYLKNDEKIFDYYNQLFDALKGKIEISVNQDVEKLNKINQQFPRKQLSESSVIYYPSAMNLEKLMIDCVELYVKKGQSEKGIELFEKIVNLNLPNKWLRYSHRADFYITLKKYQAAIDDLTSVIFGNNEIYPQHPNYILCLIKRGRLYEAVNQSDKAIADYETVKTLNPNNEKTMDEMIAKAKQKQIENMNQSK